MVQRRSLNSLNSTSGSHNKQCISNIIKSVYGTLGLYFSGSGKERQEDEGVSNSISSGTNLRSNLVAESSYSIPSHSS